MKEDNVYEDTTRAEKTEGQEDGAGRKNTENESGLPPKFKSVSALARAYEALQAEFTRRSQRLKELERQTENFANRTQQDGAETERKETPSGKTEAEYVQEANVAKPETENQKPLEVSAFKEFSQSGQATEEMTLAQGEKLASEYTGKERESELSQHRDAEVTPVSEGVLNGGNAHDAVAESGDAAVLSQSLYEQARRDENVRLKIIGEYLSSIGKTDAPLMAGGVGTLTTPPKKAKSISQAGNMALLYFKKPMQM